jgi:photosystem II stability/assembly factor-like uncharacterized protein
MQRFYILLVFGLVLAACDKGATGPDDSNGTGSNTIAMTALQDLPMIGGNVTGIAIAGDNTIIAAVDGKIYKMSAAGGALQLINGDPVHTAIGLAPTGELYTVAGTDFRTYDPGTGTFKSAPIDPAGPFAQSRRIEQADFFFSPAGEPYVRLINNTPQTFIYHTTDKGATWINQKLPPAFVYNGGFAFAPNGDMLMSSIYGFYRSTDGGATWSTSPAPSSNYGGEMLAAANGDIYHYAIGAGGLKVSHNGGASFTDLYLVNHPPYFTLLRQGSDGALYALGARAAVGSDPYNRPTSLLRSTDGGATWTNVLYAQGRTFAMRGTTIAVGISGLSATQGGTGGGIYLSSNGGATFSSYGLRPLQTFSDVGFDRSGNMMTLADGGLYRKTATGWQLLGAQPGLFARFATTPKGEMLIANTASVLYSSDDGVTWSENPITDYQSGSPGTVAVTSLIGRRNGGFLLSITTYKDETGYFNGQIFTVGSDGKPTKIQGVTQSFASIVEDHNGTLYGGTMTLSQISYTFQGQGYVSSDGGVTWTEMEKNAQVGLAFNSRNRYFMVTGTDTYTMRAPGSDAKPELKLTGFTSQGNYIRRAVFGPDDRLYLITLDKGVFVSNAPVE